MFAPSRQESCLIEFWGRRPIIRSNSILHTWACYSVTLFHTNNILHTSPIAQVRLTTIIHSGGGSQVANHLHPGVSLETKLCSFACQHLALNRDFCVKEVLNNRNSPSIQIHSNLSSYPSAVGRPLIIFNWYGEWWNVHPHCTFGRRSLSGNPWPVLRWSSLSDFLRWEFSGDERWRSFWCRVTFRATWAQKYQILLGMLCTSIFQFSSLRIMLWWLQRCRF